MKIKLCSLHINFLPKNSTVLAKLGKLSPISHYPADLWHQVMQVNINAPFMLSQACFPSLSQAPHASVVFISSSVGRQGRAYWGAYGVSKFALEGLSETLADEWDSQTNIRVNSFNPGATRTKMRALAYPGENPKSLKEPADIMPQLLYLMGDDSLEVNGEQLSSWV